ncbi:karyopherin beta [Phlyctochytrium planicorne]|nr:karyopherin beta [Phlyctochytrium planicorne]
MTTGITELLHNTLSHDLGIRQHAEKSLEALSAQFPQYVEALCYELANEGNVPAIRQAAGVAFKNSVSAKDPQLRDQYAQRWLQVDSGLRDKIKEMLFVTLNTAVPQAGSAVASAVHAIAEIELPQNLWPDVIDKLCTNVHNSANKEYTLQALGYICETDQKVLQEDGNPNKILTAIALGAQRSEPNPKVRAAAIKALINSLEFAKNNFQSEPERNYIMLIVCEATQGNMEELVVSAYECLAKIMLLYYDYMQVYMEKALIALTITGMQHENENIALQSIDFWSTICEEEAYRKQDQTNYYKFAEMNAPRIIPILVHLMTKKEENDDEDLWNVPMAAATCLSFLASVLEDGIISYIFKWILQHLLNQDWRYREAAVMAFGSILDGLSSQILKTCLNETFLPLLNIMKQDSNVLVKDTTAWTLGRICEKFGVHELGESQALGHLMEVLIAGLNDNPRIAVNCAWSIMKLAESVDLFDGRVYPLQPYFDAAIASLIKNAEGKSSQESNLKATAYEAIGSLVRTSSRECELTVIKLYRDVLEKLHMTIGMQDEVLNSDDRLALQELQSNLCSVLTNIVRRLGSGICDSADDVMTILLQILTKTSKNSTVYEDVFILSAIAVGLVGDICRALNADVASYCQKIMEILLVNLQSDQLDRTVKPAILSCFGDISLAIGGQFDIYVHHVLPVLQKAMIYATEFKEDLPYEEQEYFKILREGILEAFVGIVQGLASANKINIMEAYIDTVFQFMERIQLEREHMQDEASPLASPMVGLLGDIADAFPQRTLHERFNKPWVEKLLKELRQSGQQKDIELSRWAKGRIKKQI